MRQYSVSRLEIWPAERFVIVLSLAALAINLVQIFWRGIEVDWAGYSVTVGVALATFAAGQFYRLSGRSERIGAALTGTALLVFFTMAISAFNYLLMPITRPSIDPALVRLDALFGYHWPDMIVLAAEYPVLSEVLRYAYLSTMPQIAFLLIVLGLTGRVRDLHDLIAFVAITATMAIVFWGFFPSHGASSQFALPASLEQAVNPVVGTAYGQELVRLAAEGPGRLVPDEIRGVIGFPSYHSVLALIAVYAARNLKWVFPVFLSINILIIPATLIQGGHHLADIPAGFILFFIGLWITRKTIDQHYETSGRPELLAKET